MHVYDIYDILIGTFVFHIAIFLLTFLGYDCHPHNVGCPLRHYEAHAAVNLHSTRRFSGKV